MLAPSLLALVALATPAHAEHAKSCLLSVTPDPIYSSYLVHVQLPGGCPGPEYIRKRSEINPQLILPAEGSWEVTPRLGWNVWVQHWDIEQFVPRTRSWVVIWPPKGGGGAFP